MKERVIHQVVGSLSAACSCLSLFVGKQARPAAGFPLESRDDQSTHQLMSSCMACMVAGEKRKLLGERRKPAPPGEGSTGGVW